MVLPIIGLDRLKVIHVNDSKNPQGSHKDRHANINSRQRPQGGIGSPAELIATICNTRC